ELQRIENRGQRPRAEGKVDQRGMKRMPERTSMKELLRFASGNARGFEERSNRFLHRRGDGIERFLIAESTYELFDRHARLGRASDMPIRRVDSDAFG